MDVLDFDAFAQAELHTDPFPYCCVPHFIKTDHYSQISAAFPQLNKPGSFPMASLDCNQRFSDFVAQLQGSAMTAAFSEKFSYDLEPYPTMVTIRGMCRQKDGQIHTDSRSKVLTVLLYVNDTWESDGGRLRLLHNGDDIDAVIAECEPGPGTMLAFLNAENAWHGHTSFAGQRRAIQLNWVTDESVVKREQSRHRFAARLKKLNPFV